LWDVHDESTAQLMGYFYQNYIQSADMARSLQRAMQELRHKKPHPFYWAPFVLVGKLTDSKRLA
jgi:CHAT domain-containing protein